MLRFPSAILDAVRSICERAHAGQLRSAMSWLVLQSMGLTSPSNCLGGPPGESREPRHYRAVVEWFRDLTPILHHGVLGLAALGLGWFAQEGLALLYRRNHLVRADLLFLMAEWVIFAWVGLALLLTSVTSLIDLSVSLHTGGKRFRASKDPSAGSKASHIPRDLEPIVRNALLLSAVFVLVGTSQFITAALVVEHHPGTVAAAYSAAEWVEITWMVFAILVTGLYTMIDLVWALLINR